MRNTLIALLAALLLTGCGGSPLSLLTGGGPNVAANVQAGKTNSQTLGVTNHTEQKLVRPQARTIEQSTGDNSVRAERVEHVTVNQTDWVMLSLLIFFAGLVIPSPAEIARGIRNLFTRNKAGA